MTDSLVTTGPPPPPFVERTRRSRWWGIAGSALLVLVVVAVITANLVHVPYVIISPGDATPLDDNVVSVLGVPTHPHKGQFLFLTVQVSTRDPTVWRWLFAKLDGDVDIVKREAVNGCASYEENARINDLFMRESQETAKTLALRRLGYEVTQKSSAIVIRNIPCGGPSFGKLQLADQLLEVDGQPITAADQVRPIVSKHEPGDTIDVAVERDGARRNIEITLGKAPCFRKEGCKSLENYPPNLPKPGDPYLGIESQEITDEQFPFDVQIDTRRVSGPSAGLAFTLALIDELTSGELTGGRRVAVTGEILPDGHVVVVGGVAQKTVAAEQSGATLMIVPKGEAKEAREHADQMRVVGVDTLDEALTALERSGGDPVPAEPAETPTQ